MREIFGREVSVGLLREARWRIPLALLVGVPAVLTAVHVVGATAKARGQAIDRQELAWYVGTAVVGLLAVALTRCPPLCLGSAALMLLWLPSNMRPDRSDEVDVHLGVAMLMVLTIQLGLLALSLLIDTANFIRDRSTKSTASP